MKRGQPSRATRASPGAQRGVALISAMLLLLIITILALSMFRSFPTQEKIAGNVLEKERAFHAANSALQFAEWWLAGNSASAEVLCGAQAPLPNGNNGNGNEVQICSNPLYTLLQGGIPTDVAQVPWAVGGGGVANIGVSYTPVGMTVQGSATQTPNDSATYLTAPVFYIADLGRAGDGQGEAYQIDAYAYGGSANTVAVVESVYEIAQGVVSRSGP